MRRKLPPSAALALAIIIVTASVASAATLWAPTVSGRTGKADFAAGSEVNSGGGVMTGQKPESKLLYTPDGRWWAVFGESTAARRGVFLYELVDHTWVARVQLHADPWMKADALFVESGDTLFVALRDSKALSGNPRQSVLVQLTYVGVGAWSTVSPPVLITTKAIETLTIARDSTSRIWAAWEAARTIQVASWQLGATAFSPSTTISTTQVNADDIAAITSLGSGAIGVLWSDQVKRQFLFASRSDTAPLTKAAWTIETAYGGNVGGCPTTTATLCADDHLNVKVVGDELFAAVKTSNNDSANALASDPLVVLLRRSAAGVWSAAQVSDVALDHTRPIVTVSPTDDKLYVFSSELGDGTFYWETSLSAPTFGSPSPWTDYGARAIGDATTTKQPMNPAFGLVVETSLGATYWRNEILPTVSA